MRGRHLAGPADGIPAALAGVRTSALNVLHNMFGNRWPTPEEIASKSSTELLRVKGLGRTGVSSISEALAKCDLALRDPGIGVLGLSEITRLRLDLAEAARLLGAVAISGDCSPSVLAEIRRRAAAFVARVSPKELAPQKTQEDR